MTTAAEFVVNLPPAGLWASFAHADLRTGALFFAGFCDAGSVLNGTLWQAHGGWRRYAASIGDVKAQGAYIAVRYSIHLTGRDAYLRAVDDKEKENIPDAMFIGGVSPTTRTAVRCIQTGDIFQTAAAAANWAGVQQSNMSAHLSGKAGYPQLKGYTFERI